MKFNTIILLLVFALFCSFGGCKKGINAKCGDKIKDLKLEKSDIGTTIDVECPAGCSNAAVWGTDTYTTDSSICTAALHAGAISADKGGAVKVSVVKSLPSYKGSERNGVTTRDWSSSWGAKAFTVAK